jgi:uncharacterized protein YndB with AHSA1/START domain
MNCPRANAPWRDGPVRRASCLALGVVLLAVQARAEVVQSAPDGALMEHHFSLRTAPMDAWQTLVHPERWWPEDHTWSGKRGNLSLAPVAGGCYCETWDGGSVEHARVVMAMPGRLLRMRGALGPLQDMAVSGVLTVRLEPNEHGTNVTVTYRLSGDASHQLDEFVPIVDRVIGQQFGAFAARSDEGASR